jgi:hypothetical protein
LVGKQAAKQKGYMRLRTLFHHQPSGAASAALLVFYFTMTPAPNFAGLR